MTVGQTLYLARFEVQGGAASAAKDPAQFTWDFGDGTTGVGKSVSHVYFKEGPYVVKLKSPASLAPAQRTFCLYNAAVTPRPLRALTGLAT